MIPDFDSRGNLPPGIHVATLAEIEERFVYNECRKRLFEALREVVRMFQESQCAEIYLNGSYITNKAEPVDYDLCWEPTGIKPTKKLEQFLVHRKHRKERYLGDVFVRYPEPPFHFDHSVEWQKDKNGNPKGIVRIVVAHDQE